MIDLKRVFDIITVLCAVSELFQREDNSVRQV